MTNNDTYTMQFTYDEINSLKTIIENSYNNPDCNMGKVWSSWMLYRFNDALETPKTTESTKKYLGEEQIEKMIEEMIKNTSNTFEDCLKMPLAVLLETVKNIRISELMHNDKWREAYLKQKAKGSNKNNKSNEQTKMDILGLKSFANALIEKTKENV